MTITAAALLAKVSKTLQDETGVRWPIDTEMLGWLDSGQRETVFLKPDILATTVSMLLAEGTKQVLPVGGMSLLDVVRNMGTDGDTPGRAITAIPREILDTSLPDWHSSTPNAEVKHFTHQDNNVKTFYVYPPQPAVSPGYVELVQSVAPTTIAADTDTISLDDIYENVLIDYCLYRAYAKDNEHTFSAERSANYRSTYMEALGLREQVEAANAPEAQVAKATKQIGARE